MEKQIKVLSSVYPENPLPFNEWINFVSKSSEQIAREQVSGNTNSNQPGNFNGWASEVFNSIN
jgi:hypothetical protein